ncbi:hypothetical protein [Mycobacteroides abscessus]|uniref:hypothetical protein n=1 Tax=Mycobacteroides abscessus TaxID=36809 RepID=UPI001056A662|nr:hypothetical protein [Mycobacteroides abscessus]
MSFEYPAIAPAFYVQSTPGKARLFIGEFGSHSRSIVPVTTVTAGSDREAERLVAALESAAWHGDRGPWDALAQVLPEAVVLACNQALAAAPPHTSLAISSDGLPMTVLRSTVMLVPGGEELRRQAAAAHEAGLQVLIDNYLDDYLGAVCCRLRVLSGNTELVQGSADSAWPQEGQGAAVERQMFGAGQLDDILKDPRWLSNQARVHWVWLTDEGDEPVFSDYSSEAVWVVEYFDEAVPEDPEPVEPEEWQQFVVGDWNPWPMTHRTRFVLWQSLIGIEVMLDTGLEGWAENETRPEDDEFMDDFPELVRSQPRSWWLELLQACSRLVDAMRTGESWNPRTPAEEALIYLACRTGWTQFARDIINERGVLRTQFAALPEGAEWDPDEDLPGEEPGDLPDYDWAEVPGALAGDEDIEFLWSADMRGIEDPENPTNIYLSMGDYRPQSWHRRFHRYVKDAEPESALY